MDHDAPDRQLLKLVNILSVIPARADTPLSGEPIAIVAYEHEGEIETPLTLRLRDTRALAAGLIGVVEHHEQRDVEIFGVSEEKEKRDPLEERRMRRRQITIPDDLLEKWVHRRRCGGCRRRHETGHVVMKELLCKRGTWTLELELVCHHCGLRAEVGVNLIALMKGFRR
jgi:hypothetical protein